MLRFKKPPLSGLKSSVHSKAESFRSFTRDEEAVITSTRLALLKEDKVLNVFYEPHSPFRWNVAVDDDGTDRAGLALYLCGVLEESGAQMQGVFLRIVAADQVREGKSFEQSALGAVRCEDYQPIPV